MKTKKKAVRRVTSVAMKHPKLLGHPVTYDVRENPLGDAPHSSQSLKAQPLDGSLRQNSSEAMLSSLDQQSIVPSQGQGCSVNSFHAPCPTVNIAMSASANEEGQCHVPILTYFSFSYAC